MRKWRTTPAAKAPKWASQAAPAVGMRVKREMPWRERAEVRKVTLDQGKKAKAAWTAAQNPIVKMVREGISKSGTPKKEKNHFIFPQG
jgi:hypothetical protein